MVNLHELEEDETKEKTVPEPIGPVLKDVEDVMPPELQTGLPLKIGEDHKIELELGDKPPTKAPYQISIPNSKGLQKKLKDLVKSNETRRVRIERGLLHTKGQKVCTPKWKNLQKNLAKEWHVSKWTNAKRMPLEFDVGDLVTVKILIE